MLLDILKLPDKYRFNEDAIKSGNYIDDGSLLVYYKLMQGWFSGKDTAMSFLWGKPIEWSSKDFVAYLLKLSREYNLKIGNVDVIWGAIEDDFEKKLFDDKDEVLPEYKDELLIYFKKKDEFDKKIKEGKIDKNDIHAWFEQVQKYNPKHFEGSYKWALEQLKNSPNSDFSQLFNRLKTGKATADDIERALVYADRTVPNIVNMQDDQEAEASQSSEIMGRVISYISFSIIITENDRQKIKDDISNYLDLFIKDKLNKGKERIRIQNTNIKYPNNILNFKTHNNMFSGYLKEMIEKYGNEFRVINKFEKESPYDDSEFSSDDIKERYRNKDFLFVHCVLSFKQLGLIQTNGISSNWDALDVKPLSYSCDVKILPIFLGNVIPDNLYFDKNKSRLYIKSKEIKILKFKDEYNTLRIIFDNPDELDKEWFFSEIKERVDMYGKGDDKKYYNAIYQVGLKLAKKGIDDFFITTKQSVKINTKYLS
jgi:hypothetical protein